jgi:hypothetical protein
MALFEAIVGTAAAIVKALPDPFKVAYAIAMGLAQIAAISSQPIPSLDTGGMLVQDQIIQAHKGEVVVSMEDLASHLADALGGLGSGGAPIHVTVQLGSRVLYDDISRALDNGQIMVNPRSIKR